jgi:hypothetical protein
MPIRTRVLIAAAGLALAGGVLAAAPAAFAAGTPGPSASPISGSVTIPSSLTLSFTATSFSLTPADMTTALANSNTPAVGITDPGAGIITVGSNDSHGYFVAVTGPSPAFLAGSAQFPTSDVSADVVTGDSTAHAYGALSASAGLTVMSSSAVSGSYESGSPPAGYDAVPFYGFAINTMPGNAAVGTYTGTVTMVLWGN